ncbi:MAG: hypothetical protein CVV64_19480 [Candidatus Wallbacteria bacterium HGW-Wallbacteria-1]|jgi:regulator of protease activity HflC (stomatin/prohibitin superfamily)|uniref:Band 7 domain-containing protein n=1 Tax=Candidatus Wallbacteria bacterium HGW-Wallbacteria-1 TaxID=2013854 RepID=A0A2N1PIW7_9BACT|nr:MAG: hypothetical protein CVV64_19480 [Candidatus Wallbacteria bacterium HGW-Wallbacteria-1]
MLIPRIYFLNEDEQLLIEGLGNRRIVNGPGSVVTPPFTRTEKFRACVVDATQYLRVMDRLSGDITIVKGPTLFFREAHEEILEKCSAVILRQNQFIRILDRETGRMRVEKGDQIVFLDAHEEVVQGPCDGINVDEHQAVLVRNVKTGELSLETSKQVFFPQDFQEIVEVREKTILADHETVVVMGPEGKFTYFSGSGKQRSFFLDPYSSLVKFRWSAGLTKEQRSLQLTHIDTRPKFMWYQFGARTRDNVELVLNITFFWQILDVHGMVEKTDDAPGDICSHARSRIIQCVSKLSFEEFLQDFNNTVQAAVLDSGDKFYSERGCSIHSVEVRSIECQDEAIQKVLEEIIKETTNRVNLLQKQKTENEIRVESLRGELETEKGRGELIAVRESNLMGEAVAEGRARAENIRTFIDGLGKELSMEQKLTVFRMLKTGENIENLSSGNAQLFLTPDDCDLRIQTSASEPVAGKRELRRKKE